MGMSKSSLDEIRPDEMEIMHHGDAHVPKALPGERE